MSILIVDDDKAWQDILFRLLKKDHAIVDIAKDAEEAENKLKNTDYKLLITDVRLQERCTGEDIRETDAINRKEGVKVLNIAKRINPAIKSIVITAYKEDIKKNLECDYFLSKQLPYDNDSFRKLIIDLIS